MQKQVAVLSITVLSLISILTGVGYFYIQDRINPDDSFAGQSSTASQTQPNTQQNQPQQQNTAFQVQGAQNEQRQNTASARLPEPSEFSVYEQYSTSQRTQFIDIVVGNGDEAFSGDTLAVVYSGYLTNGQLFDQSSVNEQNEIEPFVLKLGGGTVIQGWEEGIVGMKVGGQRRLIIPPQLAYGQQGAADGAIPPNAMLIFDVQLVQVQKETTTQ